MLEEKELYKFELVLQVRNLDGTPKGQTKSFVTDDANALDDWHERNRFKPIIARKNKGQKHAKTSGKDGENILKQLLLDQEREGAASE